MGSVARGAAGGHAHLLGVGVGEKRAEPLAPEHDQHPVLGLVGDGDVDPRDGDARPKALDHLDRLVVGQAPGPAVGDAALGVEGGQVAAGGHVARTHLDLEAGGRERAPTELVLDGVVAEERHVGGTRTGGDAGAHRVVQTDAAGGGQGVEVGGVGLLQLGPPVGTGEAGEAVEHHQHDLAGRGLDERGQVEGHPPSLEKGESGFRRVWVGRLGVGRSGGGRS